MNIKEFLKRFSNTKKIEHSREYWAQMFFEQILPQIEQVSNQSRYGYHGLTHTTQVALFGLDIAYTINQHPLPVLLAAGLHDCARTSDKWCMMHGPNAVPIAQNFLAKNYPELSGSDVKKIINAVKNHTIGRRAPNGVAACLWDGDRIRLSWEMGYKPECFSTTRGRQIAGLTPIEQKEYLIRQDNFLINNNIRTREQIEFERQQDEIQNKIGTQFKNNCR
jgi:HD superfamily phosphohydrolase YqeK